MPIIKYCTSFESASIDYFIWTLPWEYQEFRGIFCLSLYYHKMKIHRQHWEWMAIVCSVVRGNDVCISRTFYGKLRSSSSTLFCYWCCLPSRHRDLFFFSLITNFWISCHIVHNLFANRNKYRFYLMRNLKCQQLSFFHRERGKERKRKIDYFQLFHWPTESSQICSLQSS